MLIAIDTGGTKTLVTSFNNRGIMGEQFRFPTPIDPKEYINELSAILIEKYHNKSIDAIVIGTPGVIKNGIISWGGGNLPWKNFDVISKLKGILNNAPIFIENDAKLAGLSETRALKTIPMQSLYVTISTGIGTGIITNGHIDQALKNSEGGHILIEYKGKVQEWEKFASGKTVYNTYGKYARDIKNKRIWKQIADRISRGFLVIIPILQPDVIIIGGSMGTYFQRYGETLTTILKNKLPEHIAIPKFVKAKYPELAVIYGCYYYALDNIHHK